MLLLRHEHSEIESPHPHSHPSRVGFGWGGGIHQPGIPTGVGEIFSSLFCFFVFISCVIFAGSCVFVRHIKEISKSLNWSSARVANHQSVISQSSANSDFLWMEITPCLNVRSVRRGGFIVSQKCVSWKKLPSNSWKRFAINPENRHEKAWIYPETPVIFSSQSDRGSPENPIGLISSGSLTGTLTPLAT